jgi:ankyrin repeat protein
MMGIGFPTLGFSENRMFNRQIFAKSILTLAGLTAGIHINAMPAAEAPNLAAPNPVSPAPATGTSKPDPAAMHCAITQYQQWVRAQSRPLDPELKAKKLQEIDQACGSSLHLSNVITAYDSPAGAAQEPKQGVAAIVTGAPPTPAATGPAFAELVDGPLDNLVAYLSRPGNDVNERNTKFETLLDVAADHNKTLAAKFLLDHGADIEASPGQGTRFHGNTALFHAAFLNSIEVAQLLITRGANIDSHPDTADARTPTPLCAAASQGNLQMVVLLLNHGADADAEFGVHQTPLSEALAHGHMDVVRALMDHGAKLKSQYLAAAAMQGRVEATKLLLTQPMDQASKDDALRFAILGDPEHSTERIQIVQDLLDHGANIDNLKSVPDVIPVMFATTPDMAEFLFSHGANREAKLPGAQIAQAFVCNKATRDPVGMLQVLIARGIDLSGPTPRGSALTCATQADNQALLSFLKEHHVGISSANDNTASVAPPALAVAQEKHVSPKRACGRFDQIDNSHTPVELYASVADCVENNRDDDAVGLFILAGMDSSFDFLRVADKTAGQARQILIMGLFGGMPPDVRARFQTATKEIMDQPKRRAVLCKQINKIGPPQYFPAYMVHHGLGAVQSALSNQPPPAPLEPNFDAAATWANLLTNYLNCGSETSPAPRLMQLKSTPAKGISKEIITSVLTTADGRQLVVMTSHFHYVFEPPAPLLAALKGSFHPYVHATFSAFHADIVGTTSGTVTLSVTSAPDDALASAIAAGFTKTPDGAVFATTLHGHRYTAGDVQPTAQYRLNRPYEIEIEDDLRNYKKPSPIVMAAGYLTIYGILLVVAPQVYTSR